MTPLEITLDSYRKSWRQYIRNTPPVPKVWNDWLAWAAQNSPKPILEIGSGSGRDADFLEGIGHPVHRTDAVSGFVAHMMAAGHNAEILNILEQAPEKKYGLVIAAAVLHHFRPRQADLAVRNIAGCLRPRGVFACMVRRGTGAHVDVAKTGLPRHYWLWQPAGLWHLLDTHLETFVMRYEQDKGGEWLFAAARKR